MLLLATASFGRCWPPPPPPKSGVAPAAPPPKGSVRSNPSPVPEEYHAAPCRQDSGQQQQPKLTEAGSAPQAESITLLDGGSTTGFRQQEPEVQVPLKQFPEDKLTPDNQLLQECQDPEGLPVRAMRPSTKVYDRKNLCTKTSGLEVTVDAEKGSMMPSIHLPVSEFLFFHSIGQIPGAALDLVESHVAFAELCQEADSKGLTPTELLDAYIDTIVLEKKLAYRALLATGVYVSPDSTAHPQLTESTDAHGSSVVGMSKMTSGASPIELLAVLYLATVQALAYSQRMMIERCSNKVRDEQITFVACGNVAKNKLYAQEHADVLGRPVYVLPDLNCLAGTPCGPMLACAYPQVDEAIRGATPGDCMMPCQDSILCSFHASRFEIFKRMEQHQQEYRVLERRSLVAEPPAAA